MALRLEIAVKPTVVAMTALTTTPQHTVVIWASLFHFEPGLAVGFPCYFVFAIAFELFHEPTASRAQPLCVSLLRFPVVMPGRPFLLPAVLL